MGDPTESTTPGPRHLAGIALLHPLPLAALALLLLNDHVLKPVAPGPVTGKLSDVAGLAFFPILLVAGWELARSVTGRRPATTWRPTIIAVILTGVAFAAVKTIPEAAAAFGWGLGVAQWAIAAPVRIAQDLPLPPMIRARVILDPTDLLALPALAVALWVGGVRWPDTSPLRRRAPAGADGTTALSGRLS